MRRRKHPARRGRRPTPSITSARPPLGEDVNRRTTRYLVSMGIRTACLVLAVLVDGPLRWAFLAGAILLPYVAVVMANAGRERAEPPQSLLEPNRITDRDERPDDRDEPRDDRDEPRDDRRS